MVWSKVGHIFVLRDKEDDARNFGLSMAVLARLRLAKLRTIAWYTAEAYQQATIRYKYKPLQKTLYRGINSVSPAFPVCFIQFTAKHFEMIMANSALCAWFVICHLVSNTRNSEHVCNLQTVRSRVDTMDGKRLVNNLNANNQSRHFPVDTSSG